MPITSKAKDFGVVNLDWASLIKTEIDILYINYIRFGGRYVIFVNETESHINFINKLGKDQKNVGTLIKGGRDIFHTYKNY